MGDQGIEPCRPALFDEEVEIPFRINDFPPLARTADEDLQALAADGHGAVDRQVQRAADAHVGAELHKRDS